MTVHISIHDDGHSACGARLVGGHHGYGPHGYGPHGYGVAAGATLLLGDPERSQATAPPDDPERSQATAPPDDPERSQATAPPDDPSGGYRGSVTGCGCGSSNLVSSMVGGGSSSDGARSPAYSGFVIFRLDEAHARSAYGIDQAFQDAHPELEEIIDLLRRETKNGVDAKETAKVSADGFLPSRPLIRNCDLVDSRGPATATVFEALTELEARALARGLRIGPSLRRYWRLDTRSLKSETIADLVAELRAVSAVDLAYRELLATDPSLDSGYAAAQGYLDDAPVGMGIRRVWSRFGSNAGSIDVYDLEQRFTLSHEALDDVGPLLYGDNRAIEDAENGDHGTAVLAQLVASKGHVSRMTPDNITAYPLSHWDSASKSNGHVADALVNLITQRVLGPPDIILLEVQRAGGPTELDPADATAIQLATAIGVTVIEPAGNGGLDLDAQLDVRGRPTLRRGSDAFIDTGAVMVGASWSTLPHDRASFSSYGSRVDCHAWGDSVVTAGYGDLDPGPDAIKRYTASFSGTSSAAACIAGAAATVQSLHVGSTDQPYWPRELRTILADPATGTPQGPNITGLIGVMPDLAKLLDNEVPELSFRCSIADDGFSCRDVTFSCPDIQIVVDSATDPIPRPERHDPAPGLSWLPVSSKMVIAAHPQNLGQQPTGDTVARAYVAPPATFVTPDMWRVVSSEPMTLQPVQKGSFANDDPGLLWEANLPPADGYRAVLVALQRGTKLDQLTNVWRYRSLEDYLGFLDRDSVGTRNVYRIDSARDPIDVPFAFTNMPDRARTFDFEMRQYLPRGCTVVLETDLLARALIRRNNPWIGDTNTAPITLPNKTYLSFKDVRLPTAAICESTLTISGGSQGTITARHGVIIRQLYRGREIGRITWCFTEP
ncbi:MAG: S8 family serine peptidase [Acidobacteriota bacterium]